MSSGFQVIGLCARCPACGKVERIFGCRLLQQARGRTTASAMQRVTADGAVRTMRACQKTGEHDAVLSQQIGQAAPKQFKRRLGDAAARHAGLVTGDEYAIAELLDQLQRRPIHPSKGQYLGAGIAGRRLRQNGILVKKDCAHHVPRERGRNAAAGQVQYEMECTPFPKVPVPAFTQRRVQAFLMQ